jgi:GR25 family glycosyltransferase involved in LPS biosynthesis
MQSGYIIHLPGATEREPHVAALRAALALEPLEWKLQVFSASDGSEWAALPTMGKLHPRNSVPVSQGVIGCAHSHLSIIQHALETQKAGVIIFEDDCQLRIGAAKAIDDFMYHVNTDLSGKWDMLLLGANEYVEAGRVSPQAWQVKRFWGTHAIILRRRACEAVLEAFRAHQKEGYFPPADWLINAAIVIGQLVCYAPDTPTSFCQQVPGLRSAITGEVRENVP